MTTKLKDTQLLELADNLKKARRKVSITQEKLALESGLDRSYISRLERGLANPTYLSLKSIAKALDMPLTNILQK